MIARFWHGTVPVEKSGKHLDLMQSVAILDYKATPGDLDPFCLHRVENGIAHFEMPIFWENIEAIRHFAGEDYECAKYYEFGDEFLVKKKSKVRHFEVYREKT